LRIFKTRWFNRFARQELIEAAALKDAIDRASLGLIDAHLGSGLIKQRVARQGQGRSGGYRVLIAFKLGDIAVFLFGFAKNARENVSADELLTLRELASAWSKADERTLKQAIENGALIEVGDDG
jgi:hypothetical protein